VPRTSPICEFLREGHVPCSIVPHGWTPPSAHPEIAATHVRGRDFAKVIVCLVDGKPVEAILHASLAVNLSRLLALTGGSELRVPKDEEVELLFPKRDRETMPTFTQFYGQSVFVDVALVVAPEMVFKAGEDLETICVRWADFAKTVRPIVGQFAEPPLLWARYRLSPRE
jgi:Ala-tRNA(Pro) deacylase